jgi:hypothetical protein
MIVGRFAPTLKSPPATVKRAKPAPLSIFHKATLTARRKRMKVTLPRPCERSAALDCNPVQAENAPSASPSGPQTASLAE